MLVDTNIVLLLLQPDHPMTLAAERAMKALTAEGHALSVTPQNLVEMWAVATKPIDRNGLGLSPTEADEAMDSILKLFALLPDTPDIFPVWREIVNAHNITGRSVYDGRLVAAMRVHGETAILTFDTGLNRYQIQVVNLAGVIEPKEPPRQPIPQDDSGT